MVSDNVDPYAPVGLRKHVQRLLPKPVRQSVRLALNGVPRPVRRSVRLALNRFQETTFKLTGLPPRRVRLSISPAWFDFKKTGRDQMEFFTELAGLRTSDRVLDIACGVGRIAIPLSHFFDSCGSYEGFDLNASSIEWCQNNITARHPKFGFTVADVRSPISPSATHTAESYVFPYEEKSFSFAYAGSIFTHLLPKGAENYLAQTARVLRPGGRFVATWLLYNKDLASLMPETFGGLAKHWSHDYGEYRIKQLKDPGESVAYDVSLVRRLYEKSGLTIVEPFRVDASYSPARIPSDRDLGIHLYYALSIIAIRR